MIGEIDSRNSSHLHCTKTISNSCGSGAKRLCNTSMVIQAKYPQFIWMLWNGICHLLIIITPQQRNHWNAGYLPDAERYSALQLTCKATRSPKAEVACLVICPGSEITAMTLHLPVEACRMPTSSVCQCLGKNGHLASC